MKLLSIFTGLCLIVSLVINRQKTWAGVKKGALMFLRLLPTLMFMLFLVSIVLYLIPEEKLAKYMGEGSGITGWATAALFGSVALIPGFIAYPLCGILVKSGVAYSVIAVFITTLMMTGFLTLPVEAKFFGWRISIIRNLISLSAFLMFGYPVIKLKNTLGRSQDGKVQDLSFCLQHSRQGHFMALSLLRIYFGKRDAAYAMFLFT